MKFSGRDLLRTHKALVQCPSVSLLVSPVSKLLVHSTLATLVLSQFSNSMKHHDSQTIVPAVSFVLVWFFETGSFCVFLAVLELTV